MTIGHGQKISTPKKRLVQAILTALTLTPAYLNAAQDENQQRESEIEVVTVTAQKRVQNILKVPVTVGTVSEDTIEESGSVLLSDIDKFIPGFNFSDGNMTQAGVSMRGISSPNISIGGDPSSATFYDDVYMPRAAQNVVFSDMARVEVLKGPQGTLFGRNAAMGVVNMVPKSPFADFEGFVKATIGTDNLHRYEGMINVPLTDSIYVRANALTNEQDGFVKNIDDSAWHNGSKVWDLGARDHSAARISLLWDISSATNLQFSYDWDDLEQAPPMAIGFSEFAYDGGKSYLGSTAENDVRNGVESRDMSGMTAKFNHEFSNEWSMKYLVSYREWQTVNREDEDGTSDVTRYFDTSNNEDSDIFYTELQFNYVSDKINAVTGFSYSKEDVSQTSELNLTSDTAARLITGDLNSQIDQLVSGQVADMLGGNTDAHAAGAFGPGVTFAGAVQTIKQSMGIEEMDHMWNPDEWSNTLTALGLADQIMAAIGMPGQELTPEIVTATGDLTYDIVATQLPAIANPDVPPEFLPAYIPELYGPSYAGQFWQETVNNTGEFTNWGIFADVDYAINDKWNIIGGLRYSKDEKDFTWYIPTNTFSTVPVNSIIAMSGGDQIPIENIIFQEVNYSASESWDKITGRFVTSYQATDTDMYFASYSTGYKSGGFDSLGAVPGSQPLSFDPEDTTNYEIGYKGIWWDQVIANISGYYLELENQQTGVSSKRPDDVAAVPLVISLDREITGIELDLRWMATDSLTLGVLSEVRSTDTFTPSYYNGEGTLVEAKEKSEDAALNYTLTIDWMPDFGIGTTNLHLDYVFTENTNAQIVGLEEYKKAIPEYFLDTKNLNARISWANDNDSIEVGVWGKNLLDEQHVVSIGGLTASILGTPFGRITRGLEAGIDFKYSF
ncbi:TonB-dependent receptor [Thalassotalea sp. PLHSN55]|uniref:TonB-dependent receptor n=1 Tax=Thalassotalea sp. PLHSN55 TaxID=3435888 RepID=UPI003F83491B